MSRPDLSEYYKSEVTSLSTWERTKLALGHYPLIPLGVFTAIGIIGWRFKNMKKRGDVRMSNYIIYTRMYAQGFIVTCMIATVSYQMVKNYQKRKPISDKENTEKAKNSDL